MNATIKDIMSTRVVTVRGDTPFKEMAAMLGRTRVSAFPVTDEAGKIIGIVSEGDMLIKEADQAGHPGLFTGLRRSREHERAAGVTAADVMTRAPVTIGPDESVERAAFLMYDHGIKRLPVVDGAGHLAGIVSRADVLSVFDRPDEEIRRDIIQELLLRSFLVDPQHLGVTVDNGVVTLSGRPESEHLGRQIAEAVQHVDGVVAVHDQLAYSAQRPPSGQVLPVAQ
ncbi:MAG: CBS domain-containing protein [Streptosporangiaceae bacterium]